MSREKSNAGNAASGVAASEQQFEQSIVNAERTLDDAASAIRAGSPITIDPATVSGPGTLNGNGSDGAGSEPVKRRGRPPGSGSGRRAAATKTTAPLNITGAESILLSIHGILLAMTGVQEFQITTDEAHKVAEAAVNVSRHYDVEASEKAMDWTNLILALAMVYGTRLFAFTQRRQRETPSEKKAGNSSAFIPGVGPMPLTH